MNAILMNCATLGSVGNQLSGEEKYQMEGGILARKSATQQLDATIMQMKKNQP